MYKLFGYFSEPQQQNIQPYTSMTRQHMLIPAILTTQNFLRIFLAHGDEEFRHQAFSTDDYTDVPLPGHSVPNRNERITRVRKLCKRVQESGPLDAFGKILRFNGYSAVWAVQVVKKSTIKDRRSLFHHENHESETTVMELTPLHIIFGQKITKTRALTMIRWARKEGRKLQAKRASEKEWTRRGLSIYAGHCKSLRKKKGRYVIKMGEANFLPFDPNTMIFDPLKE